MTLYYYKAVGADGKSRFGELDAASKEVAVADLVSQGLTPLFAGETPPRQDVRERFARFLRERSFGPRELAMVTLELGDLLAAGFSLDEALGASAELAKGAEAKARLGELQSRVRSGEALSAALKRKPKSFPAYYVGLVRAGEAAGDLAGALGRLGGMLDRSEKVKEKIRSALIYPVLLLVMIAVTMSVVLTFVIPSFEPFFEDLGTELPLATRIVLGIGGFVGDYGSLLLIGLLAAGFGLRWLLQRPAIALRRDLWLFRTRLLLGLPQKREVGEFCRTLGVMLAQGAKLQVAFESAGEVGQNRAFKAAVNEVSLGVREGAKLGPELKGTRLFPDIAVRLISLGEETGNLPQMLCRVGDLFERQVELAIDRLLAILVPVLTILMGLIVAGFIGSILVGLMAVTNIG